MEYPINFINCFYENEDKTPLTEDQMEAYNFLAKGLNDKQNFIINRKYKQEKTYAWIATKLKVTEERVIELEGDIINTFFLPKIYLIEDGLLGFGKKEIMKENPQVEIIPIESVGFSSAIKNILKRNNINTVKELEDVFKKNQFLGLNYLGLVRLKELLSSLDEFYNNTYYTSTYGNITEEDFVEYNRYVMCKDYPRNLLKDIYKIKVSEFSEKQLNGLDYLISNLTEIEKHFIDLYYKNKNGIKEISEILEIEKEKVSVIKNSVLQYFRKNINCIELGVDAYLEDKKRIEDLKNQIPKDLEDGNLKNLNTLAMELDLEELNAILPRKIFNLYKKRNIRSIYEVIKLLEEKDVKKQKGIGNESLLVTIETLDKYFNTDYFSKRNQEVWHY